MYARRLLICLALLIILFPSCTKDETHKVNLEQSVVANKILKRDSSTSVEDLTKPEDLAQKFSYVYGYQQSQALLLSYDLDENYIAKGILDGAKASGFFSEAEMQKILTDYIAQLQSEQNAEVAKIQSENLEKAEEFLAVNKTRKTVKTTDSGLQYEMLREGSGKKPSSDSVVNVQYRVTLLSGEVVDSSYSRSTSTQLNLSSSLITGFKEAVMLLKEGGKLRAWLHPSLGYGTYGSNSVQPNELLIFDIELLSIEK